ncbi:protein YCF54, chloroplastic-like [Rutidosis leptorrhynchoides]|uniref:protein YCF54, chloroplastic-like n=1 Tax=Rutidosis leptorrhynchoides TaxID=125765 RepID=UPI003A99ACF2
MSLMKSLGASAVINLPTAAAITTTTAQLHHSTHSLPFLSVPQHLPKLNTTNITWKTTTPVRTSVAAANSSDTVEKEAESTKKYHFVVANAKFMLDDEEHFQEQLFERVRLFKERNMEQDFWLVIEPKFLDKFPDITKRLKRPAVALVSTNGTWIKFMKLRLDRVLEESFEADSLEEALACNPAKLEFEKPKNWVAPYPKYEYGWWKSFLPATAQKQQV